MPRARPSSFASAARPCSFKHDTAAPSCPPFDVIARVAAHRWAEYLCKPSDNVYEIDFIAYKLRNLDMGVTLFEVAKDADAEFEMADDDDDSGAAAVRTTASGDDCRLLTLRRPLRRVQLPS